MGGLGELAVELAQRLVSRPWPEAERIVEVEQLPGRSPTRGAWWSACSAAYACSSKRQRLFATAKPRTPQTCTSAAWLPARSSSGNAARASASTSSNPSSGESCARALPLRRSANKRERGFPISISPGYAAYCKRAATLTASPVTRRSSVPVTTSPVVRPMRRCKRSSGKAWRISTAGRQARRVSFSWASGTRKTANRVADELLHAVLVPLDDLLHPLEVPRQQRAQRLRVGRLPERGRAHDVAEQDGDDLALLRTRRARRSPALGTELERLDGLVAANSTSRHHPSVGRPDWKKTSFFLV